MPAGKNIPNGFVEAVQAYRQGDYREAQQSFLRLHEHAPENSRITYYLAITEAQLGRFQQAKKLYDEILVLDPNSEAAKLAKEGLQYLPEDSAALDHPPRFKAQGKQHATAADSESTTNPQASGPAGSAPAQTAASPWGAVSPQDMMMLQMMMGGGSSGNGNNSGFNPMPYMMMQQPGSNPNTAGGMGNIDPSVMSSLIMNQMMQNFSLDSGKDSDR